MHEIKVKTRQGKIRFCLYWCFVLGQLKFLCEGVNLPGPCLQGRPAALGFCLLNAAALLLNAAKLCGPALVRL